MLAVESLIAGGRNMVPHHECLGKVLAPFQHGTSFRGADDRDVLRPIVLLHVIVDAFYQWILWTNHHHVYSLLHAERLDSLEIIGFYGYVLANIQRAGVAWSNVQLLTFLTLGYFPCQCVLTAATA